MARTTRASRSGRRTARSSAGGPFCFAGLWTRWASADGEVVPSCTIITCEANELVRPIHDRVPVVFPYSEFSQAWLRSSKPTEHWALQVVADLSFLLGGDPDTTARLLRPAIAIEA